MSTDTMSTDTMSTDTKEYVAEGLINMLMTARASLNLLIEQQGVTEDTLGEITTLANDLKQAVENYRTAYRVPKT
jgi:hypothetical protein